MLYPLSCIRSFHIFNSRYGYYATISMFVMPRAHSLGARELRLGGAALECWPGHGRAAADWPWRKRKDQLYDRPRRQGFGVLAGCRRRALHAARERGAASLI